MDVKLRENSINGKPKILKENGLNPENTEK
jgi:hypothetical protein